MTAEIEERIRARAHAIWEQEGRPEGRSDEHWHRACEEVAFEHATPKKAARKRPAAKATARKPATSSKTKAAAPLDATAESPKPKRATRSRKAAAEPGKSA